MPYQVQVFEETPPLRPNMSIVTDGEAFERMHLQCLNAPKLVFDFETSGLDWWGHSEACGIALAVPDSPTWRCWYVPFRHQVAGPQLVLSPAMHVALGQLLSRPDSLKIAHNLKFDEHFAWKEGWRVCGPRYDTMIAARLYNENDPAALKWRAVHDLGHPDADEMEKRLNRELKKLAKRLRMKITDYKERYGYAQVPIGIAGVYACFDVQYAGELYEFYEKNRVSTAFERVWKVETELTGVLRRMEHYGMLVDADYLDTLRDVVGGVKAGVEDQIAKKLGSNMFNLGSDDDLRRFLRHDLGLPLTRKTKGGVHAVDREVLEDFVGHESLGIIPLIMKWRDAEKIYTTYTTSLLKKLDAQSRLHGELKQVGTNTGRLSSANPNLQNIAGDDNDRAVTYSGKELKEGGVDPWSVRRAFLIDPGRVRLIFDYSQIELRVLAFYSKDPIMVDVYMHNGDIHKRTQDEVSAVLGKAIERRKAKVVNFGLCLAEGQRVLTRQDGLVPIEQVSCWHELWDGVEWVKHEGLVCRGEQEVITYDGITATPDHKVFTCDGEEIQIGKLSSEIRPRQLAVGAVEETPVGFSASHWSDQDEETRRQWACAKSEIRGSGLLDVFKDEVASFVECLFRKEHELYLPTEVQGSESEDPWSAIRFHGAALRERYARVVSQLQGSGYPGPLQVAGALCVVGSGNVSRLGFQGTGFRSDRQRWALSSRQFEVGRPVYQSAQLQKAKVYDLINAGPRHRFTIEGKIVSNSYCLSAQGLARQTRMPQHEADNFMDAFFKRYAGIATFREEFWKTVRLHGGAFVNRWGRPRRVPDLFSQKGWERGRAERQAIGSLIQGTAAELTKESLCRLQRWIDWSGVNANLVSTVHDEIWIDVAIRDMAYTARCVKQIMEDYDEFAPLPVLVEGKYCIRNWAEKEALPT